MKTKTELCKCGHEHNNHLPDGRCGCGGVTSTGQDWHCSCSYYTPKGKESAAKDGLLRKEPNKVATPPLSAPLKPFEEQLKASKVKYKDDLGNGYNAGVDAAIVLHQKLCHPEIDEEKLAEWFNNRHMHECTGCSYSMDSARSEAKEAIEYAKRK